MQYSVFKTNKSVENIYEDNEASSSSSSWTSNSIRVAFVSCRKLRCFLLFRMKRINVSGCQWCTHTWQSLADWMDGWLAQWLTAKSVIHTNTQTHTHTELNSKLNSYSNIWNALPYEMLLIFMMNFYCCCCYCFCSSSSSTFIIISGSFYDKKKYKF